MYAICYLKKLRVDIIDDFPHTLHPTIYISCSPTLIFLFFHFWFMHLLFASESNHCSINFFQKRSAAQMVFFFFKKKRRRKMWKTTSNNFLPVQRTLFWMYPMRIFLSIYRLLQLLMPSWQQDLWSWIGRWGHLGFCQCSFCLLFLPLLILHL